MGQATPRFCAPRIAQAKHVLETGSKVQDAMLTVGYSDPGTFRRLFTRRVGMTPAVYRRTFASPGP